jgi:hypothetical protein
MKTLKDSWRIYCIINVFVVKHILPDILFFMCGLEDGRRNEEVAMPWSGIMAVVMEELIWFYVILKKKR